MKVLESNIKRRFFLYVLLLFIAACSSYYFVNVYSINRRYHQSYDGKGEVELRKFPYPFKAALTIASDVDQTTTVEEFLKIQEFLNTKHMTEMGEGVGLEIGNSFFMFGRDSKEEFSYFSKRPVDKSVIREFVEAGYVDFLHSWGDGYRDRSDAINGIDELKKNNLKLQVWINHAQNRSNLGNWFPEICLGDNRETKYYHADLTIPYGIKFVWDYSTTCVIGQATPVSFEMFRGIYDSQYPLKSSRNVAKAIVKHALAVFGLWKSKYLHHEDNDLVKAAELNDGQRVYKFIRFDNHPDGIGYGATSKTMAYNLSERVVEQLIRVNGYLILYTHFGKNSDCSELICKETQDGLRYLEKKYRSGEVYVTTTQKILNYYINHKYLKWSSDIEGELARIDIFNVEDPLFGILVPSQKDLQGFTFYVPEGKNVLIFIDGKEIKNLVRNPADETNRESVTIPFTRLQYPKLRLQ